MATLTEQSGVLQPPFCVPDKQVRPLRKLLDDRLQRLLEKRLNENPQYAKLIRNQKMAVGLVDLSVPSKIRFARVNGPTMMYAASMPKLAILLAATQALENGSLRETPEIIEDMTKMIRYSDNPCATRMIERLGFRQINAVLRDPRYKLYDPDWGGGLWVGKRSAKLGKRYPDPINGLSHAASVTQVCRFYYLLAMGKLVNCQRSRQMLEILSDPAINHKFVNSLHRVAPEATIYRKSGTWKYWHSDSVLVWGPVWRRYILVALIEDPKGEEILREIVPAAEEVLQAFMAQRDCGRPEKRQSIIPTQGS